MNQRKRRSDQSSVFKWQDAIFDKSISPQLRIVWLMCMTFSGIVIVYQIGLFLERSKTNITF